MSRDEKEARSERIRFTAKINVDVPDLDLSKTISSTWFDRETEYLRDGKNDHQRRVDDEIRSLRAWGVKDFTVEWSSETEITIVTTITERDTALQKRSSQFYRDGVFQG